LFCYDENEDYLIVTFQDVSGKEVVEKSDHLYTLSDPSLCLYFFHLFAKKKFRKKIIFIQANSFIIFTCPNPVLLVLGFDQVGQREDCDQSGIVTANV